MLTIELAWQQAATVFAAWADDPVVAWLESGGPGDERSRYSYVAVEPFEVLQAAGSPAADPFASLAAAMSRHIPDAVSAPVPFTGGAIGFFGYELASHLEDVPRLRKGSLCPVDFHAALYDLVFAFDRVLERAWLFSSGLPAEAGAARDAHAAQRAEAALRRLESNRRVNALPLAPVRWHQETSRLVHQARVASVLRYIQAGDIYQANITARFLADRPAGSRPADIFTALIAGSPAPFAAYLACGPDLAIASASPERFISLDRDGHIETRPIKGTMKRAEPPLADAALAAALAASGKDRAENLMIVDLLRNDLSRVAMAGSVRVPSLCAVETFANVHHLVSVVQARLRPGLAACDLLRAVFPGGSVTGAPKIRAMEIIAELEGVARGVYCGAIGWLGWDGAMDTSIAIRTLTITPTTIMAQAGGGIVAESDPAAEYDEMMLKVTPLLRALDRAAEPVPRKASGR